MKTYTTDEVIDLVTKWTIQKSLLDGIESFPEWLKDKEQSEIPIKGQMIWVRDNGGEWFTRDYPMWTIHKTHKMISPIAITTSILGAIEVWDEYSFTDPNQ